MEEEIKKLREAGFTDADIQAYMNDQQSRKGQPQAVDPAKVDMTQPPLADEKVPAYGAPPGTSALEDVATIGTAVAPYAGPAALAALGIYGAAKVGGWGSNMLKTAQTAGEAYKTGVAQNAATQEFRALERMARGTGSEAEAAKQRLQQLIRTQSGVPTGTPPQAGSQAFSQMGQQLSQARPVAPTTTTPLTTNTQPSIMQRGMDMANRMRQFAAQRVLPVAGVPGAVAAGGAAATGIAGGQMGAMTPEQRRAYYENSMLGAMGGDAGLAAAIMNRGQ